MHCPLCSPCWAANLVVRWQESLRACKDTACPPGPGAGREEVQWRWHRHCWSGNGVCDFHLQQECHCRAAALSTGHHVMEWSAIWQSFWQIWWISSTWEWYGKSAPILSFASLIFYFLQWAKIPCSNALYPSISFKDRKLWLLFLHLSGHSLLSFVEHNLFLDNKIWIYIRRWLPCHQLVSKYVGKLFLSAEDAMLSKWLTYYAFVVSDYAFSHRKFGGNAQSITKNRWVHHTSFLWDYDVKNMDYLKIPKRAPEYRLVWSYLFVLIWFSASFVHRHWEWCLEWTSPMRLSNLSIFNFDICYSELIRQETVHQ